MTLFEKFAERFVLPRRMDRLRSVLAERTLYVVPVFENVRKAHNASAVVRTCDALGIAAAHFIEYDNSFCLHPEISLGAHDWVEQKTWKTVPECFASLHATGYAIVGTTLHDRAILPEELPLDRPLAFVFGNERDGLMPETVAACDILVRLPMRGFVESLNVSVAAALLMHNHLERVRAIGDDRLKLSGRDRKRILRRWIFECTRVGGIVRKMRHQKRIKAGLESGGDED